MKYLKYSLGTVDRGSVVEVTLSGTEANVQLVDSSNLSSYHRGDSFSYYGGHYTRSPARITVPRTGTWYVVVDLGGFGGSVNASVKVLSGSAGGSSSDKGTTTKDSSSGTGANSSNTGSVANSSRKQASPTGKGDPFAEFMERYGNGEVKLSPVGSFSSRIVDASDVFGMRYQDDQPEDEFWNHHNRTKDDYIELASKLPEVQAELASGKTLDEIKANPALAACASQYYSHDNMVKVYSYGDSYLLSEDGRHRVMAAQTLGYQMPVNITHLVNHN
jgi:hypothetical protein